MCDNRNNDNSNNKSPSSCIEEVGATALKDKATALKWDKTLSIYDMMQELSQD